MRRVIVCLVVAATLLAATVASAAIRNVPADYATIQSAINASATDDTVMVAPGTYYECLDFGARTIRVLSSGGSALTTLRPNPITPFLPIVRFAGGGTGTEFAGFTLDGGSMKHAIELLNGSQPSIHHNVIINHVSYEGNATEIGSYFSTPVIAYNLFIHNRSIGGVGIFSGGGEILNNTFHDCSRGFWSQGTGVVAKNNIVTNSVEFGIAGDGFAVADYNCVYANDPDYDYGAVAGASDIALAPEYCDPILDNYGLDVISPCLGSGEGGVDRGAFGAACGTDLGPRVMALTVSGDQAMHVTDPTPEISWTYMDPDGQPQFESEIEVGTNPDWAIAELWAPPTFSGNSTSQTYAGATLANGTNYYVRARVHNGIVWGAWTNRLFRTNTPPPTPTMIAPGENAIVTSTSPSLSIMYHVDAEGDFQLFDFEVYSDAGLTDLVTSGSNRPTPWNVPSAPLSENQPHWWRVRSSDGFETSPWSGTRAFFLDAQDSPPIPGQLLEPVGNVAVPKTVPYFDWEDATDIDPGQTSFSQSLIIATDSNFTFATQVSGLSASEFTYSALMVSQRYWWKVRFTDSDGLSTDSPSQRFFIPGPGDMDVNLVINLVDVVLVIDVVFRGATEPAAFYLADVSGDCKLDILDVVRMIDHAYRSGPLPLTLCPTPAEALRVPSEYATINSAILAAVDGNTILVAPGVYRENVNFEGKHIHLVSEGGPDVTIIEPFEETLPTISLVNGEPFGTELSGFTLRGGTGQHAVWIMNGSIPYIHNNIIRDHVTFYHNATAVGSYNSNPRIEFNLFVHTRSLGGIGIFTGGGTIQNNTFDDNSRGYWSQGSGVIARNNIVTNSLEFGIGASGFAINDYNCTYNNVVEYCCGAIPGANDFTEDPLYCDPLVLNYNLAPGSLCTASGFGGVNRGAFPALCPGP